MVVKEFVELLEDYLQGGDAPVEVRSKYDHRVLREWITSAMLTLIHQGRNDFGAASITNLIQEYGGIDGLPISVDASDGKYKATLPSSPLGGQETVFALRDVNGSMVSIARPGAETQIMSYLKGCGCRGSVQGNQIVFNSNPGIDKVWVSMIPSIREMDDHEQLNLPGDYRIRVFDIIVSFLLKKKGISEDTKNDQVDGSGKQ